MKYLLFFALVLFGIITAWVIRLHGCHNSLSLSMHVAKSKKASLIFGIFGSIATTAAAIAVFAELLPAVNANFVVYGVLLIIFGQLYIAALFPHIEGSKLGAIHNFAAWGMCLVIPFATAAFLFTDINALLTIVTIATLLIEITLLSITLGFGIVPKQRHFLYYQLAYLGVFFSHLLILTWSV